MEQKLVVLVVVYVAKGGFKIPLLIGNREECYHYMRNNKDWNDLMYWNSNGTIGKFASWTLTKSKTSVK